MGLAIVFHTSRGDVLTLQGSQARKRRSFLAPSDAQIVGLQFQGVAFSMISEPFSRLFKAFQGFASAFGEDPML